MSSFRLTLGQTGRFHLKEGSTKRIKVLGIESNPTTSDKPMLILEVDNIEGIFPDLQSALGEQYIGVLVE